MKSFRNHPNSSAKPLAMFALSAGLAMTPLYVKAQMAMPASQSQPTTESATPTQDTQAQITALRQQVIKLQDALKQSKSMKSGSSQGATGSEKPAAGMDRMADGNGEMGAMPAGGGAMKDQNPSAMEAKACCGMSMGKPMAKSGGQPQDGKMGGMSQGMPGQAGSPMAGAKMTETPHLLHIGAKDFYLDHAQHLGLTAEQKQNLEKVKMAATSDKAASQKQIAVAQGELWQLTSADQPNTNAIDAKVKEIATMQADEQVMFIHSVAEASNMLTPQQTMQAVQPMASTGKSSMGKKGSKMAKPAMNQPMKME